MNSARKSIQNVYFQLTFCIQNLDYGVAIITCAHAKNTIRYCDSCYTANHDKRMNVMRLSMPWMVWDAHSNLHSAPCPMMQCEGIKCIHWLVAPPCSSWTLVLTSCNSCIGGLYCRVVITVLVSLYIIAV